MLKLTTNGHEESRGLSATAELLVLHIGTKNLSVAKRSRVRCAHSMRRGRLY